MGLVRAGKSGSVNRAVELWPSLKGRRHDICEAALLARFAWLQHQPKQEKPKPIKALKRRQIRKEGLDVFVLDQ